MFLIFVPFLACASDPSPSPQLTSLPAPGDTAEAALLDDLASRVAALEERLEQAEGLLGATANDLLECRAELDATQVRVCELEAKVEDLSPKVDQLRVDVDTLWPAVEQVQRDLRECSCE